MLRYSQLNEMYKFKEAPTMTLREMVKKVSNPV